MRKGSTRLALLALLDQEESYGYAILNQLQEGGRGILSSTEATVYPLLHDLEEKGHLVSNWRSTETGVPPRKYYALTASGRELLEELRDAWSRYRAAMDHLVIPEAVLEPTEGEQ